MRIFLLLALLSLTIVGKAQRNKEKSLRVVGWEISDQKLTWSRVYFAESGSIQEFVNGLFFLSTNSSAFDLKQQDNETIIGTFSNLSLKFEEFGYSYVDTPFLISRARHSRNIEIEIKDSKYKMQITNVVSFMNTAQDGSSYRWDKDFVDRKGTIKPEMEETMVIADKNFVSIFDINSRNKDNKKP